MSQASKIKPSHTLGGLGLAITALLRQEASLLGIAQQAKQDMANLVVELDECNQLLSRKDDVLHQLGRLQQQAQAKNKGMFEEILSSLIHEIMPHKAGDKVVLSSTLRNNLAALDIDINSDGFLENVSRDKGGSISNIIAMGLRFIVLARQPNRRVLFLDEADCHLREEYIPAFASVMQQLAHRLGIQVVYISHHPASYFEGYGRIIEIYQQDGQNRSQILSDEGRPEGHEYPENAFRYIRLRDFGPHENVLVELGGGLNIITGDNDLGKSKFITAVGELLENDGQEARIRHERPFFEIEIGLEMGMSLLWKYKRVGSQKTLMELRDNQGQVIESSTLGSGKIPPWLHTYLAMGLVNDRNIHVHPQDEPKYLLSSHYTPIERAKLLPLGRESRDVSRMIQLFNQQITDARSRKVGLDKQLAKVKSLLQALSPLLDREDDSCDLQRAQKELIERCQNTDAVLSMGIEFGAVTGRRRLLEESLARVERIVLVPVGISRSSDMLSVIAGLERLSASLQNLDQVRSFPIAPKAPAIRDTKGMMRLGLELKATRDMASSLKEVSNIPSCKPPSIADRQSLLDILERASVVESRLRESGNNLAQCRQQRVAILDTKERLINALGGICPTCCQTINEEHSHD